MSSLFVHIIFNLAFILVWFVCVELAQVSNFSAQLVVHTIQMMEIKPDLAANLSLSLLLGDTLANGISLRGKIHSITDMLLTMLLQTVHTTITACPLFIQINETIFRC